MSGDEADGLDEVMITSDEKKLDDDTLFDMVVRALPRGALLTCILDCCHSGTILDLPFVRSAGQSKPEVSAKGRRQTEGRGQVVMFSGCTDAQESGDVSGEFAAGGACTNALLSVLAGEPNIPYRRLLERMQDKMAARGLAQVPQLSTASDMDIDQLFTLTTSQDAIARFPVLRDADKELNPLLPMVNSIPIPKEARTQGSLRTRGWFDSIADAAGGGDMMGMVGGFAEQAMGGGGDEEGEEGGGGGMMDMVGGFAEQAMGGGGGMGGFAGQAMQAFGGGGANAHGAYGTAAERNTQARAEAVEARGGGERKSLLIGINYIGHSPGELRGCINDVSAMCKYLDSQGFPDDPDHRMILTEEQDESLQPTKDNIIAGMQWVVSGAQPGDDLFVHYSGHGAQIRDDDGEEDDRKDEVLVPLDYNSGGGMIRDDDIYQMLVSGLPQGVRLTVILDCCHSGSAMDLPYTFKANEMTMSGVNRGDIPSMQQNPAWDFKKLAASFMSGNYGEMMGGLLGMFKKNQASPQDIPPDAQADIEEEKDNLPEVIMFSGCQDEQTSADVGNVESQFQLPEDCGPGGAGGACTSAFLETVYAPGGDNITWLELLEEMRTKLRDRGFSQIPQLSSSVPIDLKENFSLLD
eukprot:TRINITY_DN59508_c0_g2_i1.p1 TRINITY_DN59508_c0_g2~~TRINITY_DN59508_c0_g2_i1.p1  ORF type:complete len:662 (-),score=147.24 TRINITY_DN59508_c0_g2_i1:66-1970(-)